ncbi:MAG: serine protease, partial [Erythrobacter sp.]
GCEGGANDDCETLGTNVLAADPGPEDRARGYAVLTLACERGRIESCSRLEHFAGMDPADPVLSVDARYTPPLTEEEEAEQNRLEREANEAAEAEAEANRCRTSQVEFRGVVYTDTLCELRAVGVIGGRFARAGEAPWQALLWRPERMNGRTLTPAERVECGGALVRTGWILTAAHCVVDSKRRPLLTGGHQFRLGVLDARNLEGVGYPIKRVFAHPRYHEASRTFDIALVELDANQRTRVGGPHDIKIIGIDRTPIAQRPIRAGMPVYVFGWGLTTVRGNASNRLKAARLQLEAPADCEKNTATGGNNYLKSSLLCAKAPDKSQACDGDSGGPLVSYDGNLATVIGVVSAGTECGQAEKATRYTRVAKVVDWINSVFAGRETPIAPRATR